MRTLFEGARRTDSKARVMDRQNAPVVAIIMGSVSDMDTMGEARDLLTEFNIPFELKVLSAHRTPDATLEFAENAVANGLKIIIAGAGGAAHLAGVVAAKTPLPVIGVPIRTQTMGGLDSLLSIVQMPAGVPVATVAIGGAKNAALLAVRMLALSDQAIAERLRAYIDDMRERISSIRL